MTQTLEADGILKPSPDRLTHRILMCCFVCEEQRAFSIMAQNVETGWVVKTTRTSVP
jgi:hypothetical protein